MERMEEDAVPGMAKMVEEDMACGQGGMAAKKYFHSRGKPADSVCVIFWNEERRLGEVVFHGDTLQFRIREPFHEGDDGGRAPWNEFGCNRVDLIYMHIQIYYSSIPTESLLYFRP